MSDLEMDDQWLKLFRAKRFREEPEKAQELIDDARWLLALTKPQMRILEQSLQSERTGLRVSTIHKTKGMEFERVMVYGVSDRLMAETFVWYVAITRAKERLVLS